MKTILQPVVFSFLFIFSTQIIAQKPCGAERWNIKIVTDPDSSSVNIRDTIYTTVEALASTPLPLYRKNLPRQEAEKMLYCVDCYIIGFKKEGGKDGDQDYHIVLQSLACDSTIIAEIPDPFSCPETGMSPFYINYKSVRMYFEHNVCKTCNLKGERPTLKYCPKGLKARVYGIGFIDKKHGQIGLAKFNGFELHPVLDMIVYPLKDQ